MSLPSSEKKVLLDLGSCKETISFFNESELQKRSGETGDSGTCCSPNGSIQVNDEFDFGAQYTTQRNQRRFDPYAGAIINNQLI